MNSLAATGKSQSMKIEYDPTKERWNLKERGLGFGAAIELLELVEDRRRDYRERRHIAYGWLGERLHVCVYTLRGDAYRIISLRKADRREVDAYGPHVFRRGASEGT